MSYERRFALAPWRRCVRVCASAREMLSVARGCHIFQKNLILFFLELRCGVEFPTNYPCYFETPRSGLLLYFLHTVKTMNKVQASRYNLAGRRLK